MRPVDAEVHLLDQATTWRRMLRVSFGAGARPHGLGQEPPFAVPHLAIGRASGRDFNLALCGLLVLA